MNLDESPDEGARIALERLLSVIAAALEQRANLERALATRVEIEQAKGMLAERLGITVDDAFRLMRRGARMHRRRVHDVATSVLAGHDTPVEIISALHVSLAADEATHDPLHK